MLVNGRNFNTKSNLVTIPTIFENVKTEILVEIIAKKPLKNIAHYLFRKFYNSQLFGTEYFLTNFFKIKIF